MDRPIKFVAGLPTSIDFSAELHNLSAVDVERLRVMVGDYGTFVLLWHTVDYGICLSSWPWKPGVCLPGIEVEMEHNMS